MSEIVKRISSNIGEKEPGKVEFVVKVLEIAFENADIELKKSGLESLASCFKNKDTHPDEFKEALYVIDDFIQQEFDSIRNRVMKGIFEVFN